MYEVAYDAINEGQPFSNYLMLLGYFVGIVFGAGFYLKARKIKKKFDLFFSKVWLFGWVVLGGIGFTNVFFKQAECVEWRNNGTYKITEGVVKGFDPMPYSGQKSGNKSESFTLGEYRFFYSDFSEAEGCFNNTKSHGGPIDEGKKIKLYHNEGIILRVDVWRA
jgi:hypothetical protein